MVVLCLVFRGNSILISMVVLLIYTPTNSVYEFLLNPHHLLLLFLFLMIALLTGMTWKVSVGLICISLIAKDVGQFFMYLFAIWNSFNNC
jgi:hypothetical protein